MIEAFIKRVHMLHIRLDFGPARLDQTVIFIQTYSSRILLQSSKLFTSMAPWKMLVYRRVHTLPLFDSELEEIHGP